ncbi:Asp-tRNA(Asn)/Glu-tRNA(Gln) amidotransferase A subunit family amidase [Rhodovulum iodosum]|uniref:Asp-tRNA(Asn)/Glu-tRNA(Gln) amidotransferase A subunit family amidase n=1 Tax=Rhodovulum iodosum TaxID=68291 RepID=A0ABV3XW45_9RHOB|nr:amidase [Rhodovulum robiginosum]RSK36724.1 amidase [Rhodovulum robiginosum]
MPDTVDDLPGARDTARDIAQGRQTAEQAVRARLDRIADREGDLSAWVAVDAEGAIAAARALDSAPSRGPLHGVPLGVKDIFAVRGLPWRCGSPIWQDRIAGFDAGSVALARAAGAVILGKTETTEFAGYNPTRTRNPHDAARTPGGSSSGSAAAVAAGMVPLALGTQTSGSVIRPASFCGVVGYKPSFDLIETGGVAPLSRSLDTVGVFARSVPDAALAVEALTGLALQPGAATEIGTLQVYRSPVWGAAEPPLAAAWTEFEAGLGPLLDEQRFAPDIEAELAAAPALHARIMAMEAAEALAHEYARAPDLLSDGLRAQLAEGRAASAKERAHDRRAMRRLRHLFEGHVAPDSVWLTPAATGPAPAFESGTGNPAFNRIWSLLGLPCCSVPILRADGGLPMGVQVVGAMGNDRGVLRVADWLMRRF